MDLWHSALEGLGMIAPDFWKGKRVFLTGHTGFKGAWLSEYLLELGAIVKGYALAPSTDPALFSLLQLSSRLEHTEADIRDHETLTREMQSFQPEIVFHLAAQPLVRLSYRQPRETYETNVMGTLNVYEAVKSCQSVRSVVSVTTDKCYENREWVWGYRENDPMGGYDPYSSSKGCAEILSAAYRRSFFNPDQYNKTHQVALATARAGNVIGGGDWAEDRLIPDCARALHQQETVHIRSPRSTRPWQFVLEPLAGYLMLAEKLYTEGPRWAEGWNFGPGDSGVLCVEEVVRILVEAWGSGSWEVTKDADLHEANLLKLDVSKANALLKWSGKLSVAQAIQWSVEGYQKLLAGDSSVVTQQIRRYSSLN